MAALSFSKRILKLLVVLALGSRTVSQTTIQGGTSVLQASDCLLEAQVTALPNCAYVQSTYEYCNTFNDTEVLHQCLCTQKLFSALFGSVYTSAFQHVNFKAHPVMDTDARTNIGDALPLINSTPRSSPS